MQTVRIRLYTMPRTYKRKTDRPYTNHKVQELPKSGTPKVAPGFLDTLDARTNLAKELRKRWHSITQDLGGEDELSHFQKALVERAVFLEGMLQDMEMEIVKARELGGATVAAELMGRWGSATNTFISLCARLGLERQAKNYIDNYYRQPQPPVPVTTNEEPHENGNV
jgi:hypothetical protein